MAIKTSYFIWGGAIVALVGLFLYIGNSGSGSDIKGVECSPMEFANYHVHAHLDVYINGQQRAVPSNVGVFGTCLYWLHTHTPDGILHIEAPTRRTFTLGQFFDIWTKTYGNPLEGVNETNVRVIVNGKDYAGNYRDLAFDDHQIITVQFGEPFVEQEEYIFPPGV